MTHDGFSVITASTGDSTKLFRLWSSLKAQSFINWEWIVVAPTAAPAFWPTDSCARWVRKSFLSVNGARNWGATLAQKSHLLFLDDDVTLPDKAHLHRRLKAHIDRPKTVLGGGYHSPRGCGFWDKAYNVMCNLWLKRFQISDVGDLLLGGNFSLEKELFEVHRLDDEADWGGEETYSFLQWKRGGVCLLWNRSMYVEHLPEKNLISFFRTAWRQGRGRTAANTHLDSKTVVSLVTSAGWWAPILIIYWLAGEVARITTPLSEKTASEPASDKPSGTAPAKNTSI